MQVLTKLGCSAVNIVLWVNKRISTHIRSKVSRDSSVSTRVSILASEYLNIYLIVLTFKYSDSSKTLTGKEGDWKLPFSCFFKRSNIPYLFFSTMNDLSLFLLTLLIFLEGELGSPFLKIS